jgi:hypothetical protein
MAQVRAGDEEEPAFRSDACELERESTLEE